MPCCGPCGPNLCLLGEEKRTLPKFWQMVRNLIYQGEVTFDHFYKLWLKPFIIQNQKFSHYVCKYLGDNF
jgi:hypothetical protein